MTLSLNMSAGRYKKQIKSYARQGQVRHNFNPRHDCPGHSVLLNGILRYLKLCRGIHVLIIAAVHREVLGIVDGRWLSSLCVATWPYFAFRPPCELGICSTGDTIPRHDQKITKVQFTMIDSPNGNLESLYNETS